MAVVFLVLLALEMGGQLRNPYLGLLLFVAVPAVFLAGLLLIPLGLWRQRRRMAAGGRGHVLLGYLYRPYTAHAAFIRLTYLW